MERRQRTIRGIDDDAWSLLTEVRVASRTEKGALVSEAIRFWYDNLADDGQIDDGLDEGLCGDHPVSLAA